MIQCPLCLTNTASLKTNSHILPRWMVKAIKKNGQLVEANIKAGTASLTQKDMKADIVCEACETLFTKCDTFADHFFKYGYYKEKNIMRTGSDGKTTIFEIHKAEAKDELIRFVVSTIIRMHLAQSPNNDSLKPFFDRVRAEFVTDTLTSLNLKIHLFKYMALQKFHVYPTVSKEEADAVDLIIFGQRIHLFFGKVPNYLEYIVGLPKIEVMEIPGKTNKLYQDLHTFAKSTKR